MKTIIKPGMLIRGLRGEDGVDTVLSVDADRHAVFVASKNNPSGIHHRYAGTEEVRWPWEDTWTPIKPKHTPSRGDLYVHSEMRATYMATASAVGLRLVCVIGNENEPVGYYWSPTSLFCGSEDSFKYVGRAEDILRVDA